MPDESTRHYIAWIPTNSGRLSESLVIAPGYEKSEDGKYHYITSKNFSDSVCLSGKERSLYIHFVIDLASPLWKFEVEFYSEINRKQLLFSAAGTIEPNGKTIFSIIDNTSNTRCGICASEKDCHSYGDDKDSSTVDNIPNTIFTFVKQQVHTDLHHIEKVDNVIPVCVNPSDVERWYKATCNAFVAKIKSIEVDAKRLYRDRIGYKSINHIEELACDAEGFCAYFKAFVLEFNPDGTSDEPRLERAEYVISSLKSLAGKVSHRKQSRNIVATILTSSVALFVSINIMINNGAMRTPQTNGAVSHIYTIETIFIAVVFAMILHVIQFGDRVLFKFISSKVRECLQRIYIAGHDRSTLRQFSYRQKAIFYGLKYGIYIFIVGFVWGAWKILAHHF